MASYRLIGNKMRNCCNQLTVFGSKPPLRVSSKVAPTQLSFTTIALLTYDRLCSLVLLLVTLKTGFEQSQRVVIGHLNWVSAGTGVGNS